jgi:hypothetical protein
MAAPENPVGEILHVARIGFSFAREVENSQGS